MSSAPSLPQDDQHKLPNASGSVSKVDVFDWTIVDEPGSLVYINKTLLHVDPTYQRNNVSNARVLKIAREWSWRGCGALLVAHRAADLFFVFDGQHRKLAADKRSDITTLPCIVFRTDEISEEADGFIRANTVRGAMSGVDRFRAMLVAKDATAVKINELVLGAGYVVKGTGAAKSVKCVMRLMSSYESEPDVFTDAWPLIVQIHHGQSIHDRIVGGMCYLERYLRRLKQTLLKRCYTDSLIRIGHEGLIRSINEASTFYAIGGEKVWAQGIVRMLNKGRRSNRLPDVI